mmetsp:Transcript_10167/g.26331  ORF Transcript_10167/g.26331 Transcript_10167/m.26331 type:complete len:161 (-) Transcript_10167:113-595(-)
MLTEGARGGQRRRARRARREAAAKNAPPPPEPLMRESWALVGGVQGFGGHDAALQRDVDNDEAHEFWEERADGTLACVVARKPLALPRVVATPPSPRKREGGTDAKETDAKAADAKATDAKAPDAKAPDAKAVAKAADAKADAMAADAKGEASDESKKTR